jgi:sec-independent protein translocase protein TatA
VNALEPWHLLIIAGVVVVLFGAKRLPDSARSLGRSMRIFKSEMVEVRGKPATPETVAPSAVPPATPVPPPTAVPAPVPTAAVPAVATAGSHAEVR